MRFSRVLEFGLEMFLLYKEAWFTYLQTDPIGSNNSIRRLVLDKHNLKETFIKICF